MAENSNLVNRFYTAFQQRDYQTMQDCYHPDVEFSDEVFPLLKGKQAKAMWHMLVSGAKDANLKVEFNTIVPMGYTIHCNWEARYKFSLTGRKVHNKVQATLWFKDGRIIRHVDKFNFYRWSKMAFGFKGTLLGWTPFFKMKVQEGVDKRLKKFMEGSDRYKL
jgi:ketosteroid isomerase-like protein